MNTNMILKLVYKMIYYLSHILKDNLRPIWMSEKKTITNYFMEIEVRPYAPGPSRSIHLLHL